MRIVDLRSDTVTKPSPEMWQMIKSLNNSALGDDVMREDPTVNELEEKAAKLVGKEAALLVSSGTQGNLVSVLSQTQPGEEIMVEEYCHIFNNEVGNIARFGGLMVRTFPSNKGIPPFETLQGMIRNKRDIHKPSTSLFCTENTHNFHGGAIISPKYMQEMKEFTGRNELKFHLDGARIFNAAVSLKIPVTEFTKYVDSVTFCLSKGLSCPIGSIVAGSQKFIHKARKFRKMLGGGMRQAGIIASFGLTALDQKWINRLAEDHKHANYLATGIENLDLPMKAPIPDTNILIVEFPENLLITKVVAKLAEKGVLSFNISRNKIRFVTHFGITEEDITYSVEKIGEVVSTLL